MKKCLTGVLLLIAALAIVISMQPSEFRVERSTTIAAPASVVFAQVNDLQGNWNEWSPWSKLDPNAKYNFEGPPAGKDASLHWSGNHEVGEGRMTIVESVPNELVKYQLDFMKPMAGTSTAQFALKPERDNTAVTWSMEGHNNFIAKAMSLVFNCEKIVGEQFEKGLADLKTRAEAQPKPGPAAVELIPGGAPAAPPSDIMDVQEEAPAPTEE